MVTIGVLAWSMWQQSLNVLRGHVAVPIGRAIGVAVVVYVIWSVLGMLAGMPAAETWLSPFAIELIPIFVLGALCGWWVLLRRVYTNKPTPQWPWEKKTRRSGKSKSSMISGIRRATKVMMILRRRSACERSRKRAQPGTEP